MAHFMANYDLLLTPTVAVPPFPVHMQGPEQIDGRMVHPAQWVCFTLPINMTGQPAATVPAGFTCDALPVGLHIVGRHLDDPLVLRARALNRPGPGPGTGHRCSARWDSDPRRGRLRSRRPPGTMSTSVRHGGATGGPSAAPARYGTFMHLGGA